MGHGGFEVFCSGTLVYLPLRGHHFPPRRIHLSLQGNLKTLRLPQSIRDNDF